MFSLSKTRNIVILATLVTALIYLLLVFAAHTPRGRLNIIQVIATLFFLVAMARQKWAKPSAAVASNGRSTDHQMLWLALVAGAAVWAWMIPFSFISDDYALLYRARPPMASGIWEMLTRGQEGKFVRPVGFASVFLDFRLFHYWPPGYHLMNLAIHLIAVAGVFTLCRYLGMDTTMAGTAALFFAALPVQTEVVAWLGARFDQLSACLTIWAMILYLKFRKTGSWGHYTAALVCFVLAALSKENAYAFPLLLAAAEILILGGRRVKPAAGFFLIATALFLYRWQVLGGIGGYLNPVGRPATFDFGVKTIQSLLLRSPTQMLLGFNWLQPPVEGVALLAALTGTIFLALALSSKPQPGAWKRLLFSLCWMIFTILPAHSLLMVGPNLLNSRVFYMGTAGLAIFLAQVTCGGASGGGGFTQRRAAMGVLQCLLLLGVLHNIAAWRSTSELSRKLITQLQQFEPSPPPNAEFVFRSLPRSLGGVFFFQAGLPEAIKMAYARDDLNAIREEDLPAEFPTDNKARHLMRFVWQGGEEVLIAPLSH